MSLLGEKQKTIKEECRVSGVGLHTGSSVNVVFKPSAENTGINFIRVDLPSRPVIKADPAHVLVETPVPRCTTISYDGAMIHTVEHLMSVLRGLGITNLLIELDGNELPGLDGSGADYLNLFKKAGIKEQEAQAPFYRIQEPIGVELSGSSIYVFPSDELKISYLLDYPHNMLRSQYFNITIDPTIFEREIAPCRTFCLESEANELKAGGLGKGANFKNTLVVGPGGVIDNQLRFPDEFARHKILDFIGDLYLLGMPIRGHVFAVKSGHALNLRLLKKIVEQKEKYSRKGIVVGYDIGDKKEIDISDIMKILPHRYPFLLVDRVIEIEKGKKGIGIKNVTINDSYFQGHFPTRPIMPGVLMIEAMAQTGGVVVLTNEDHRGKVAFFMATDNVKFRKVVTPGDQLMMEVEVVKDRTKIAQVHAVGKVNGEVVVEADMIFSFTDASYLDL